MNSTVLRRVGGHPDWMAHVRERWTEALRVLPLKAGAALAEDDAVTFLPSEMAAQHARPSQPLAELSGEEREERGGWLKRRDLFEAAADWLKTRFSTDLSAAVICLAGYSRLGDKSLEHKRHIDFQGAPILVAPIHATSVEDLARTLRWGRSWQVLGAVVRGDLTSINQTSNVLFICDALDGDSLILTPLQPLQ